MSERGIEVSAARATASGVAEEDRSMAEMFVKPLLG
jgi:hypothetical protein